MQPDDPPRHPPGLTPLHPALERYLDEHGIEHDGFGTLSGPYEPTGTLLLASPDMQIVGALRRPGAHPEAPSIEWSLVLRTGVERSLHVVLVRSPLIEADSVVAAEVSASASSVSLPDDLRGRLRCLWAAFTRWHDIFTTQLRDIDRTRDEAWLETERERVRLDAEIVRRLRAASADLEALAT